ncbi:MAG: flagellar biosynthesis protein FliR [Actinomycetota bacterium]|jgi:flagellar biosynthetic protein FliR|nr:flagellar biosynthesis protein FliR [Actinomycetota bacterium]
MNLQVPVDQVIAILLVTIRISAWLAFAPPFNTRAIPGAVKVAFALSLSMAIGPGLASKAPPPELFPILTSVLLQVVVGLSLGFLTQMLFSAIQAAGELVDLASGFTLASLYDPLSNVSSSMFGRVNQLVAVTLLFATNGHLLLLRGFSASYDVFPLHPVSIAALTRTVTSNFGVFFISALEIAAPVMVVLFLTDLALGLISRAVPSLNVFVMSFPVKILVTLSLASVAMGLLPGAISLILDHIIAALGSATQAL